MSPVPPESPNLELCSSPNDLVSYISHLRRHGDSDFSQFGTFTASVYDSAWLSMIYKRSGSRQECLFPQCFEYVLSLQQSDGTWPAYASALDGILSTAAGLLALVTRRDQASDNQDNLLLQIEQGSSGLRHLLQNWDVTQGDQVGFEVIVPSLLGQIAQFGIQFEFPGQQQLGILNTQKLQKFRLEILYANAQVAILHSLEALVGIVDFDRVAHHCTAEHGILGSPAATAAYLIHASEWDFRAEEYLRRVVSLASDQSGGVPSGYPTCNFELSWGLSTMLSEPGFLSEAEIVNLQPLRKYLSGLISHQEGLVGFAPGILPDADDTARVLMTAELLGEEVDYSPMIRKFRAGPYFKTYEMERNSSFSANCNVLLALVSSKNAELYSQDIGTITEYLLTLWKAGDVSDKWNRSLHYSYMLLCSAFVRLLLQHASGQLQSLSKEHIIRNVALCLCQILSRTLGQQNDDGSWDDSLETTAYCVLTIAQITRLPLEEKLKYSQMRSSISRGKEYIKVHQQDPLQPRSQNYLWIEKVSYASRFLRKVYPIMALGATCQIPTEDNGLSHYFALPTGLGQMKQLFESLPLFRKSPPVSWDLLLLESSLWSTYVHDSKHAVFPPLASQKGQDKYIGLLSLAFAACNQVGNHVLSPNTLWDMIFISLLVYQADEYMEVIVPHLSIYETQSLQRSLKTEFGLEVDGEPTPRGNTKGTNLSNKGLPSPESSSPDESDLVICDIQTEATADPVQQQLASVDDMITVIRKLKDHILQHPKVLAAPRITQKELAEEVYSFLTAHITHIKSNLQLSQDDQSIPTSYHKWVRSTAAEDTSCPMAALFFLCLVSDKQDFAFDNSPLSQYLSRSLIRHLSVMCRQYNDYGSIARDMDEGNLNSLNFPEFDLSRPKIINEESHSRSGHSSQERKDQLLAIAEFERSSVNLALAQLKQTAVGSEAAIASLEVFINVTDLYGQIYVQRDFTNRVKGMTGG